MRISSSTLVGASFALTLIGGALYQHSRFPVGLFTGAAPITPLADNYIVTDNPADACNCTDGHHIPIMFQYQDKPLVGWVHANPMESPLNTVMKSAFQYHIEVDTHSS